METTSLHCKLSSSTDAISMGCPAAAAETNFQVDDLLDFPNEEDDDNTEAAVLGSPLIPHATANLLFAPSLSSSSIQLKLEAAALHEEPSHGLCVPPDELVHQLEWLSSFNEDNFFSGGDTKLLSSMPSSARASSGLKWCKDTPITTHNARDDFHSESPVSVLEHGGHAYALNHHVQRASRVRKARTGGRVWSLDILKPILLENRLKPSYENTSLLVTSYSSTYSEPLYSFLQPDDSERPYKKIKQVGANDATIDSVLVRKCMHCSVQKTPQWRAGPLGPKTLCNACGVRYKSGRLVPEYRPAASPSFVNEVHSNSHRRILEMRRAKEVESHVKHHKSKVEWAYMKRDSCVHRKSKESSLCEEVSECEEAEVSRGDGFCGEGTNGEEVSTDSGTVLCEAEADNEAHLHETPNNTMACKEKRMQENACVCNMEAVCEGESLYKEVVTADMFEQKNITSLVKMEMDKCEGLKLEGREQNEENVWCM